MSEDIIEAARRMGVIPVGLINHDAEKDRWDNRVSIITMTDGRTYRMVHHWKDWRSRQRSTVYAGRGKFIKVENFFPESDTAATTCTIKLEAFEYYVSWGDGDNLGVYINDVSPSDPGYVDLLGITSLLANINDDNTDFVLVTLLAALDGHDELWMHKDVAQRADG